MPQFSGALSSSIMLKYSEISYDLRYIFAIIKNGRDCYSLKDFRCQHALYFDITNIISNMWITGPHQPNLRFVS